MLLLKLNYHKTLYESRIFVTYAFAFNITIYIENAYTTMSGSSWDYGKYSDGREKWREAAGMEQPCYTTKTMLEGGGLGAGYARVPVMLAYMSNFGLVTEPDESGNLTTDKKPIFRLGMCFAPTFLWWNPYNVEMRIKPKKMWCHSLPQKTIWLQSYAITQNNTWNYEWSSYALSHGSSDTSFGIDYANYFINSLADEKNDIVFAPGEILFFSTSKARLASDYTHALYPFILGYHPASVAGYKAHFYAGANGSSTSPGIASGENLDAQKFYLRLRFGIGSKPDGPSGNAPDNMVVFGKEPEQLCVLTGLAGWEYSGSGQSAKKGGMSPHRLLLGWYNSQDKHLDTVFSSETMNAAYWSKDVTQHDSVAPFFIASVGYTPKSANRGIGVPFDPEDNRTKSWQHSNPALFGSALDDPDAQQRKHHPYQLSSIPVSGSMGASPMDSIGKNGIFGTNAGGEQVSFISNMEIPMHPPFSLAALSGMRLTPGWFDYDESGEAFSSKPSWLKAYVGLAADAYQLGVPGVGIGNSFADPTVPADAIYRIYNFKSEMIPKFYGDIYDHGFLINDALWDRFFMSSISDRPEKNGQVKALDVLTQFLEGEEALPVSRYVKAKTPYDNKSIIKRLMDEEGWQYVAQYLMIDGGFNVNSTSIEAWTALLQGLSKRKLVSNVNGKLSLVEPEKNDEEVLFSRFMVSTTDKSLESLGDYSPMQGSSDLRNVGGETTAWGEVRKLDSLGIRLLSEEIVKQVRERGPFLNMADFINRRLDLKNTEHALKGALQAAIDETDINDDFTDSELMIKNVGSGDYYAFSKAAEGSIHTAAPGYLIQSDILMSLGNILTVRDDCFVIRAYGCVKNANDVVLAQAWCEAIVQRGIEYVDSSNHPSESMYGASGTRKDKLCKVNQTLGRKFKIVSFRWLDNWDI